MAAAVLSSLSNPLKRLANSSKAHTGSAKRLRVAAKNGCEPKPEEIWKLNAGIEAANALQSQELLRHIPLPWRCFTAKDGSEYHMSLRKAAELTSFEFECCFDLVRTTSSTDYRASEQGWDETAKRKEMAHEDMRYILVRRCTGQDHQQAAAAVKGENDAEEESEHENVAAFLSFMLTIEDGHAVIYVYEVHLSEAVRGMGLGKHLMRLQEAIGIGTGVEKSMLTVFSRNTHAERFYRRLGYSEDEISPVDRRLRGGRVRKPEYYIFSKQLR